MTEPDQNNETPVDPATEVTPTAPVGPDSGDQQVQDTSDAQPVEVSTEAPEVHDHEVGLEDNQGEGEVEVSAQPVSGVPSSSAAVSDPKPEQTDNVERPEDGEQDVSQDPTDVPVEDETQNDNEVPSEDEDPDVVA